MKYLEKAKPSLNNPPVITLMMGAPATGKGWLIDHLRDQGEFPETLPVIDPDEIKTRDLKEDFDSYNREGYDGSEKVHEEGSYISKEIMKAFEELGAEYIQDKVFADYDSLLNEITRLGEKGFKIQIIKTFAPKGDSYKRMLKRAKDTGRFVNEKYFNMAHDNIEKTFNRLIENLPNNVTNVREFDTTNEIKLKKEIKI